MSRPFTAKYASKCADCGDKITPGDTVRFDDDDDLLVHVVCETAADVDFTPVNTASAVCPTCWVTLPCFCEVSSC